MMQENSSAGKYLTVAMLVVAVVSVASYARIYHNPFVYDDKSFIRDVPAFTQPVNAQEILTRAYFDTFGERTYRPVSTLSFFVDAELWKLKPEGCHIFSILLHLLISLLVLVILFEMFRNVPAALFGAALFAAHPVHVEAVALIDNRKELLCAIFFFAAFYLYLLWRRNSRNPVQFILLFFIASALAIFSKEMAASLTAILILYDIAFPKHDESRWATLKKGIPFYAASFIVTAAFLALRYTLFRNQTGEVSWPGGSPWWTLLTMSKAFFSYIRILLAPYSLCALYTVPDAGSFFSIYGLAATGLAACLAASLLLLRRAAAPAFAFLFFFVAWLPVSNIIPFGEIMAERYAYIPSLGLCIFAAYAFSRIRKGAAAKIAGSCALVVLFAGLASLRCGAWNGDLALWENTVSCDPLSSTAHQNLGNSLAGRGDYNGALIQYSEASECPDVEEPQKIAYNRGLALYALGRVNEAQQSFIYAIRLDPHFALPHLNLGAIAEMEGDQTLARFHYMRAIDKAPHDALAYYAAGRHRLDFSKNREDMRQAFHLLSRSVSLNPQYANARARLGEALIGLGNVSGGLEELKAALSLDPNNKFALKTMSDNHLTPDSQEMRSYYYLPNVNWFARLIIAFVAFVIAMCVLYVRYLTLE